MAGCERYQLSAVLIVSDWFVPTRRIAAASAGDIRTRTTSDLTSVCGRRLGMVSSPYAGNKERQDRLPFVTVCLAFKRRSAVNPLILGD